MAKRWLLLLVSGLMVAVGLPTIAHAAGPNLPVDIESVAATSDQLGGTLVLPDGTATLTIEVRYTECIRGGACGDDPTVMEVTIAEVAGSCSGAARCVMAPGGRRQSFQRDVAAYRNGYIREASPTLASLGFVNLRPDSWLAVMVRLRNPAGWSQTSSSSLRVAPALDPRDTVPTNLTAPELGSYGNSLSRDLAVGNWITLWSIGRWAPGAVTAPQAIRVQGARCPDAACRITDAQYQASGLQSTCQYPRNDMATQDLNCGLQPSTAITAAEPCWRARSQAQNRKGWSAWAETAVKCLPGVNAGGGANNPPQGACPLCRPDSPALDVGAIAPFRPGVGLADLIVPSITRLPVLTAENNPVSAIAAQGAVLNGTAYGAGGSTWRLPAGWRAHDPLANTTFTLFACAATERASCQAVGSWPASRLVGQSPVLSSTGPLAIQSPYARIAQTTTLVNPRGIETDQTALSDWVSVTTAASPASTPTPAPSADASGGGSPAASGGGSASASDAAQVPGSVDIPPALVAAGVDGRVTPLVGTDGAGTYQGTTLKVQVPAVEPRGVKVTATATVTPARAGKVWFTFTRTGPNGKVAVGKTWKVKVKGTKAKQRWTFQDSKPTGTYLLIVRFVPAKKGKAGAMVTKAILVK